MRLFRFLAVFSAVLLLAPFATAQAQVGVRAGLNVSSFSGQNTEGSQAELGFHGGLTAYTELGPALFAQPEVLYSQKGAALEGQDVTLRLDYIEVPLLLGLSVPTGSNLIARLYAGPHIAFKVNESVRSERFGIDAGSARDVDYGVSLGADVGARRVGATSTFGVGLRYSFGLADVLTESAFGGVGVQPDLRHRVLAVNAFYTF